MTPSAPLLRPPIPGARGQSASRPPRLGLSIPPSPNQRPVDHDAQIIPQQLPALRSRPQVPPLRLATPQGSAHLTQAAPHPRGGILPPLQIATFTTGGSTDTSAHSRSASSGDHVPNGSGTSSFASILRPSQSNDPVSAVSSVYSAGPLGDGANSMERSGSLGILPDLDKLSLEKGRPLDVEDLDDAGWKAASKENKIVELGSLGEGAGGAVTRCMLKGGKHVFALKVCLL